MRQEKKLSFENIIVKNVRRAETTEKIGALVRLSLAASDDKKGQRRFERVKLLVLIRSSISSDICHLYISGPTDCYATKRFNAVRPRGKAYIAQGPTGLNIQSSCGQPKLLFLVLNNSWISLIIGLRTEGHSHTHCQGAENKQQLIIMWIAISNKCESVKGKQLGR